MIWIATLCLLAIAAWLFFNAMNEKRWVDTHSQDETIASDEGLLANFTALTRTASLSESAKTNNQQTGSLGKAVGKVQETASKLHEQGAAHARGEATVLSRAVSKVTDKNGVVNQLADKVSSGFEHLEKKVEQRLASQKTESSENIPPPASSQISNRSQEAEKDLN